MDCEVGMMPKKAFGFLLVALLCLTQTSCAPWLGKKKPMVPERRVLTEERTQALQEQVAALQEQVDNRQYKAAKHSAKALNADFPEIAAYELQDFIKAEMFLSQNKYVRSARLYQKVLEEYLDTPLKTPSVKRLYMIGSAYLGGKEKAFLWVIRIKGYEEGVKVMESVTQAEGLEDPNGLGLKAAVDVAKHYESRKLYEEAYLKWLEVSTVWQTGPMGKEALWSMAEDKRAAYNKNVPKERPLFDASNLKTAKTYYEKFKMMFPEDAEAKKVDAILAEVNEQMAHKEYTIAQYYRRTGHVQAANTYYDMVIVNWPDTDTAQQAREALNRTSK